MKSVAVLEDGFLENRARLLEVAAFLDRIDRAGGPEQAREDYRYRALLDALDILSTGKRDRARALLLSFSDPTSEPLESAKGLKGAYGAWKAPGR